MFYTLLLLFFLRVQQHLPIASKTVKAHIAKVTAKTGKAQSYKYCHCSPRRNNDKFV